MQLIIDTSDNQNIKLGLKDKQRLAFSCSLPAAGEQAEKLLLAIEKFLKDSRISWPQITSIKAANAGPGFTSLRLGVATANALAYALNKPISPSIKRQGVSVVRPKYDRPPAISQSKTQSHA